VCASVVVSDRGPGFPAELAPRLFERFARGDGSRTRATGGAGLGLSIARAIARVHGGDVLAGSREGGGARVEIRLPTVSPAGAGAEASAAGSAGVSARRS
jgi:signal transduction histidine kinase